MGALVLNGSITRDAADVKKADAARKKAEKDALLAEEEKSMKAAKTGNAKTAAKKNVGGGGSGKATETSKGTLDLSSLDDDEEEGDNKQSALTASGIDNALDALNLTTTNVSSDKVDRHPERRYKAAYAIYEARRLPEIEAEYKGLRRQQRIEIVKKEFDKHPDNPFNQASARFDSTRDELEQIRVAERRKVDERLTTSNK